MEDEALHDVEVRRVLADPQMHRGDPRGELFALQDAGLAEEAARFLAEHHDAIYGPILAPLVRHPHNDGAPIDITWRHGLATDWVIRRPGRLEDATAALSDSLARQLRRLEIVEYPPHDADRVAGALSGIRAVASTLRSLSIHIGLSEVRDLGRSAGELPELVELTVSAAGRPGRLVAPKLARAELYAIDANELLSAEAPSLRELVLHRTARTSAFVRGLADWPALAALRRLRIQRAQLGADGLGRILAYAKAFAHLELLDLSHNGLDRARVRDARDAIPGLQIEPMSLGAG